MYICTYYRWYKQCHCDSFLSLPPLLQLNSCPPYVNTFFTFIQIYFLDCSKNRNGLNTNEERTIRSVLFLSGMSHWIMGFSDVYNGNCLRYLCFYFWTAIYAIKIICKSALWTIQLFADEEYIRPKGGKQIFMD